MTQLLPRTGHFPLDRTPIMGVAGHVGVSVDMRAAVGVRSKRIAINTRRLRYCKMHTIALQRFSVGL